MILLYLLIVLISLLFHEFGHFIISKVFGVGVEEFNIGFGPKILSKEFKGVKWNLRLLPVGGSCVVDSEDLSNVSPLKNICIFLAGPLMNLLLVFISAVIMLTAYRSFSISGVFGLTYDIGRDIVTEVPTVAKEAVETIDQSNLKVMEETMNEVIVLDRTREAIGALSLIGVIVNMILFITNLLPIPGLDGGQILFTIPKFFGKEVSPALVSTISWIFVIAIVIFSAIVMFKDVILYFL